MKRKEKREERRGKKGKKWPTKYTENTKILIYS